MNRPVIITIVVIITVLVSGGAVYWWQQSTNTCEPCNQICESCTTASTQADSKRISVLEGQVASLQQQVENYKSQKIYEADSIVSEGKKQFTNEEIGISFQYPDELGLVELTIRPGSDSGQIFRGSFSNNKNIIFGGIDAEFAEGRSGTFLDTQGYHQEDGTYYFKFVSAKPVVDKAFKLEPIETLTVDSQTVLLLSEDSFVGSRDVAGPVLQVGTGNYGALMNLQGDIFPGFAFWNKDVSTLSLDEFKGIINSIDFL